MDHPRRCQIFWPLVLAVLGITTAFASGVKIESDGGYTGLVIKIGDEVPEDACPHILENIKVSNFTIFTREHKVKVLTVSKNYFVVVGMVFLFEF